MSERSISPVERDWHHDDSERRLPSNRAVGVVWSIFFFIVACYPILKGRSPRATLLVVGTLFLVLGLAAPKALQPFNWVITRLTLLLNKVTSPVAMGLIYGLAVVPTGVLMRCFGARLLNLKFEPGKSSYWVTRAEADRRPRNFDKQF